MRSCTTWRARYSFVPGLKVISMNDSPGTDLDSIRSSQDTPASRSCSMGTVTNCSTSSAERPRASVCTRTVTGLNSGSTSMRVSRSCTTPKAMITTAIARTPRRARTDDSTIHRIISDAFPLDET